METPPRIDLLVVILNYRTPDLTIDCLRSLEPEVDAQDVVDVTVTVVDAASNDGSAELIDAMIRKKSWASWAGVLSLDHNGGFAYGNNRAIEPALNSTSPPDYVLLLNSDTVVRPGSVRELLAFMDAHPEVGIAGSRLENLDGSPRCSAFRFHSILSEFEHGLQFGPVSHILSKWTTRLPIQARPNRVGWVAGASMIVRRAVFESIGLLDEGYFLYFEESDFCLRASRAGWPCWYVPQSRVVHLAGQSSGVTGAKGSERRRPGYWFDSRHRYFRKNHGPITATLADLAWTSGHGLNRIRLAFSQRRFQGPPYLFRDFLQHTIRSWTKRPHR